MPRDKTFDPRTELVIAGIDTPDGAEHPCFDGESNSEAPNPALVRYMVRFGFFGSVVVWSSGGLRYVVAGRHRVRAAREAIEERIKLGMPPFKVEVTYWHPTPGKDRDAELLSVAMAENALRRKERTPLSMARMVARMLNANASVEAIADATGATESGVRRWVKIGQLSPALCEAIERDEIAADAALAWHGRPDSEQLALLTAWRARRDEVVEEAAATARGQRDVESMPEGAAEGVLPAQNDGAEPADDKRALVAKRRGTRPKKLGRTEAQEMIGARTSRRSRRSVRKILDMPRCAFTSEQKRAALWAIGDVSDSEAGVFADVE